MNPPAPLTLPTSLFPPISWYALLVNAPAVRIEIHETFPKQTYRNRYEILTSQGLHTLVAPVSRPGGNHTPTGKVTLNYREDWQRIHYGTIKAAYGSSPYFEFYRDTIAGFFEHRENRLINYNLHIIKELNHILGVSTEITETKEYFRGPGETADYREAFKPGKIGYKKSLRTYPQVFAHKTGFVPNLSILDLIFNLGPDALTYISGISPESPG